MFTSSYYPFSTTKKSQIRVCADNLTACPEICEYGEHERSCHQKEISCHGAK